MAVSDDEMFYLQEDLGDLICLMHKAGRYGVFSHDEKELLHKTIALLADFQVKVPKALILMYVILF